MKVAVVLLMCCVIQVQLKKVPSVMKDRWEQMVSPFHDVCINETKVQPSVADRIFEDSHLPNDEHFKCYIKCLQEYLNFSIDGQFNVDQMVKGVYALTPELAKSCVEKAYRETNPCERAFFMAQCVVYTDVS
ncbi:uncharacterized protein LOC116170577 [Photinus pyralis]|uniref:uncharacterized protein LOC116170577 n=1 Tax=Photinus pyralis TaxID=7054 RepID=UPI0012674DD5|nr:uncharacterized protein LOC116170577 [Photinus pyralis]